MKKTKASILIVYALYIAVTMLLWDLCWFQSRTANSMPIHWFLVLIGVAGQLLHLIIVLSIGRWILAPDHLPKTLKLILKNDPVAFLKYRNLAMILVVSVFMSRAVGHGLTQGGSPSASFIWDNCWDWGIAWRCHDCFTR